MFITVAITYIAAKNGYEMKGGFGPLIVDGIAWLGLTSALYEFASAGCF